MGEKDGALAIHVSGQVYGGIMSKEEFEGFHIRIEYRWGDKRSPPREKVGRDSGVTLLERGPARSRKPRGCVPPNEYLEKATGQFWSVDGSFCDVEGERVTPTMEASVPDKKEGPGERLVMYREGAAKVTSALDEGVTPNVDYEQYGGAWNTCEVVAWGNIGIHLLNGKVNLVLTDPRFTRRPAERYDS